MNPERWKQVKEIFHAALEVAPAERVAFLDKACSGDAEIRHEVESLIASHERTGEFIDAPAFEAAAHLLTDDADSLKDGEAVGDYKILRRIGRGGMGEVYLARDQRLGRNVALKVLPVSYNVFTDRLRRFETEACAASALNHPNILTIYGIGQSDSRHFIATEFIEGATLRQRIVEGGMKIDEALEISIQIASALSAAHEAGISHRDIKPENIMIRADGYVKVLDFGLAKLAEDWRGDEEDSPTRPILKTDSGAVMGTVQYMSPEQARGLPLDTRTDIWSFGIVLYEMITGSAPFDGETSSHTIVSILEDETPPLKAARPDVPAELDWIVMKALRKDRGERYQTAKELLGDLKELKHKLEFQAELERSSSSSSAKAREATGESRKEVFDREADASVAETVRIEAARNTSSMDYLTGGVRRNWRWALLAVFVPVFAFVAAYAGYRYLSGRRIEQNLKQTSSTSAPSVPLKGRQTTSWAGLDVFPSFSPDGNAIVYCSDHNGSFEIYLKQITPGGREIQLTSDGQQNLQPVWSPDGKLIAYHSNKRGGIWVIPAFGGAPRQVTDFGSHPAWSPDSSLIAFQSQSAIDFQINSSGVQPPSNIWTVPATGGTPKQITRQDNPAGDGHGCPSWSPDGRRIAFIAVELGSIRTTIWSVARDGGDVKLITEGVKKQSANFDPVYAPDGRSLYYSGGTGGRGWGILKVPTSPETGEATGPPAVLKETGWTIFRNLQVSADGKRLIHSALDMTSNLWSVQVSASGEAVGQPLILTQDTTFRKSSPSFSSDGKRIAYQKFAVGDNHDIWLMDADGKNQTQLTTDPGSELFANWFPQGDRIAFLYNEPNKPISLRSIDVQTGREETLLQPKGDLGFLQLSPDGKIFAFNYTENGATNVWTVSLDDKELKQLTFEKDLAGFPRWSPDGQFVAFESRQGDNSHIKIIPREGGEARQLTFEKGQRFTGGWSPDGSKISFAGYRGSVWNVWWVTRDGAREKQVTNNTKLNVFVRYPTWSPLGNQIVFEYAEVKGNIWITDLE
ncbi:MAG: PD40 domain-containing protein [Pyrinomonadaceae bacterium]|nr:PD40 domain-containing protein [Pyrinomonadaceae bacterium]